MNLFKLSYVALMILSAPALVQAQIQGLWEARELSLDREIVTPFDARWVEFREDGSFVQGIGGRIEEMGTWELSEDGIYSMVLLNGKNSRLNGASISVMGDSATITVVEDGHVMLAGLSRTARIPLASWDKCIGEWASSDVGSEDQLFMFFDHRFVHKVDGASSSGYWVISTNLEDLTTVEDNGKIMHWKLSFPTDSTMHCLSEFGDLLKFKKAN